MDKKNLHISHIGKKFFTLFFIYLAMFLIIFFSSELSSGIKNGINVSINLVIPSMFIFMIFANIIIKSKLKYIFSRPFKSIAKHVFKISENNIAIVILSLLGGYPVGAKLISNAVNNNEMSKGEASNMLCYCVNCSPAFVISGVGVTLFSNKVIGVYMYISQLIACLVTGFIMSFFNKKYIQKENSMNETKKISYSVLFVNSVKDAINTMIIICGFIVAFSAFTPILCNGQKHLGHEYSYIVQGIWEVTTGCNNLSSLSGQNSIILAMAFLSFGGICVHLQVYAMISQCDIKMTKFFITRVIYVLISVLSTKVMLMLSPTAVNCITYNPTITKDIYSVSPTATIFMILLSVILLFFTKKSDNIKS